jgi:hypothetical protein
MVTLAEAEEMRVHVETMVRESSSLMMSVVDHAGDNAQDQKPILGGGKIVN